MLAVLAYGLWHLTWYWQTPLGQSPVLDERENLDLARQIAQGALPAEPFYRAMLYPILLAFPFWVGVPEAFIPQAATAFGLGLHLLGTILVGSIGRHWCGNRSAGFMAAALYGLNPVLIHHATQILDGTLGNVLFLAGLCALTRAVATEAPGRWWLGGGIAWGLAGLARPQLLVLIVALAPVAWLLRNRRPNRTEGLKLAGVAAVPVALLLLQGFVQLQHSGTFRILPTQGAYNLWAANKPGANGRYFAQSIYLPSADQQQNPTKIESLVLYQRETGASTTDLDAANRHWQRRFRETLASEPLAVVAVELRKLYYLLNHQEQYNNKTYSFHKDRSPALRWNPLGWGWLWALGLAGGAAILLRRQHALGVALALLFVILAVGILTGYASGRFRLPLVALLACTAGGVVQLSEVLRHTSRRRLTIIASLWFVLAATAFTRFGDVADRSTYLQDHLLLAAAAERTGDDVTTWQEAGAALVLAPSRPDALAMRITSYFNLLLQGKGPASEPAWWRSAASYLSSKPSVRNPEVEVIGAVALWRSGDDTASAALLRSLLHSPGSARLDALAALLLIEAATETEIQTFKELTQLEAGGVLSHIAKASISLTSDPQHEPILAARRHLKNRP